jgi:hypothetical protein
MTTDPGTAKMFPPSSLVCAIRSGEYDEALDEITQAVAARKQRLTPEPIVGGRGRLKNGRPLYLNGAPFTIVKINPKRVVLRIDEDWLDAHPQAKTRWGGEVTAPRQMLDFD